MEDVMEAKLPEISNKELLRKLLTASTYPLEKRGMHQIPVEIDIAKDGHRGFVDMGECELHGFDFEIQGAYGFSSIFDFSRELLEYKDRILMSHREQDDGRPGRFGFYLIRKQ